MLNKTSAYIKSYDRQSKLMYFLTEDDGLLEKYNTIWDKFSADIKKNLVASLSIIIIIWKSKLNPMTMKLQIFMIKKFLSQTLIILV